MDRNIIENKCCLFGVKYLLPQPSVYRINKNLLSSFPVYHSFYQVIVVGHFQPLQLLHPQAISFSAKKSSIFRLFFPIPIGSLRIVYNLTNRSSCDFIRLELNSGIRESWEFRGRCRGTEGSFHVCGRDRWLRAIDRWSLVKVESFWRLSGVVIDL